MPNKAPLLNPVLMSGLPASASSNEEIPANEDAATQQIVRMIEQNVRAEAVNGLARRGAHAKAHGCVKAEFRVLSNLPEEVRAGIFREEARAYSAWIRYSNGFGKVQEDSAGDGRGMAIKLMGVERSQTGTQDFIMINHPVFFVRNAADYVEFQEVLSEDKPFKFFFPGLNPFKFRLPTEMPIEDPTLEWSENDSPFIPVARITIPAQDFTSSEQLEFCENLSFTPWHAIPEHRPLGGINRMRKTVYDTISRVRHELNSIEQHEPADF